MRGLEDQVIVIGGGATNIGAESARRLAQEGAKVVVGDFNLEGAEKTAHEIEAAGGTAIAVYYDQTDQETIAKLVATTVDHFGRLNGLHANANDMAILNRDRDVLGTDIDVWERTLQVGLIGHAMVVRAAVPHLIEAGGGGIVFTSSDACSIGQKARVAYAATKAGLNALMRHVARRHGKDGIRANALALGAITEERASDEFRARVLPAYPSHRLGKTSDIAAAVAFLLSKDAEWVTGQVWGIDGGFYLRQ